MFFMFFFFFTHSFVHSFFFQFSIFTVQVSNDTHNMNCFRNIQNEKEKKNEKFFSLIT